MRNILSNNVEYVDLGLSVKWCSHNVGGVKPSDYGIYLAWGGIAEKCSYAASYYDYDKPFEDVGEKHGLGGRVPTQAEFRELEDKCQSFWGEYYGVKGRYFIGPNGNAIFMPAAGSRIGTVVYSAGMYGYYWSSTDYSSHYAYHFYFYSDDVFSFTNDNRCFGNSVRLVQD